MSTLKFYNSYKFTNLKGLSQNHSISQTLNDHATSFFHNSLKDLSILSLIFYGINISKYKYRQILKFLEFFFNIVDIK